MSDPQRLHDEVERLREQLATLQQQLDRQSSLAVKHRPSDRRTVLKLAGSAIAGTVAGVALGRPAAAVDPNDVVKNVANQLTTATTGLTGAYNSAVLDVRNTTNTSGSRAIYASAGATDTGAIRGDNSNAEGIGGVGVSGFSPGGRDFLAFGSGRIGINSHSFSLATHQYTTGEIHQSSGVLYSMVNATTRRAISGPLTAGALWPINPVRVYDSRVASPSPGELASGGSRLISVADARNPDSGAVVTPNVVPVGATAVVFNITITGTTGGGFLAIAPGSATEATTSIINWGSGGVTVANASTVGINSDRQVNVFGGGAGTTHFIIDVSGYYL